MSKKAVQLYSSWFCPFAQRAWIALIEKGVDFNYNEIDPYNKTKEFLSINPRGLVPVIVNSGQCVYESSICIEYVDEAFDGPSLMPSDPYERSQVRIWSDFISKRIVPQYYIALQRQTKPEQEEAMSTLLAALDTLCGEMSPEGPFFTGKDFGMVDIMLVPHAIRFEVLAHFRGFAVPKNGSFARFHQWRDACMSRKSITESTASLERYIQIYQRYADNSAKTEVADAVRGNTVMP